MLTTPPNQHETSTHELTLKLPSPKAYISHPPSSISSQKSHPSTERERKREREIRILQSFLKSPAANTLLFQEFLQTPSFCCCSLFYLKLSGEFQPSTVPGQALTINPSRTKNLTPECSTASIELHNVKAKTGRRKP